MELLTTGIRRKREKYIVEIKCSLLWETALGIAAITNESLSSTLDLPPEEKEAITQALSLEMKTQLDYVRTHNTWKTLLQLLHQEDFSDLDAFTDYINSLSATNLKRVAIPYLGENEEQLTDGLLSGSEEALQQLQKRTAEHPFLPAYLAFIFNVSAEELKNQLIEVMAGWYNAVVEPNREKLQSILQRDQASKEQMLTRMEADQFVEWATDGVSYPPEPSVHKVILIPHYIYRPWNIEADLEGVKVFYYAVANESIADDNEFAPNKLMVQRFKALGDETRLKMLKMIKENNMSLQELTNQLDLGKTTVHHHLKILKSARLVSQSANEYKIEMSALEELPVALASYLETYS